MVKSYELSNTENWLEWFWGSLGEFSVSSAISFLDSGSFPIDTVSSRWNNLVPIKFNIIFYILGWFAFLQGQNLMDKCIDLDSIICPACLEELSQWCICSLIGPIIGVFRL